MGGWVAGERVVGGSERVGAELQAGRSSPSLAASKWQASVNLVANSGSPRTALLVAAIGGSLSLAAALLERRANPQAAALVGGVAQTPLDVATARDHHALRKLLVEHGAQTARQLWRPELGAQHVLDKDKAVRVCGAPAWCGPANSNTQP